MASPTTKFKNLYRAHGIRGIAEHLAAEVAKIGQRRPPVEKFWSEYLTWLTWANPGMLARGNVYSMDFAIRNLPSGSPIVEIGSFAGLSANVIGYLKQRHGAANRLITCDRWIFELRPGDEAKQLADSPTVSHADYRKLVKAAFLQNVRTFSGHDLPWTIELLSDEFFAAWTAEEKRHDVFDREIQLGGPISFCYIDGNHSYEFAKRDFENCDRYLERRGFMLLDDSADGSPWEVCRVVREILDSGRYETVAKNPNYLFRKK
ncbi:MAG TPA: class I SAM-dependent methyltransferase [Pirellulales bacterium]|nr:class I SAM-dependent methyltransferase [Pirellulales bacterium]